MSFYKKLLGFLFSILIVFLLIFCYENLFDIRLSNLQERLPYNSAWEIKPLDKEEKSLVATIFTQPFTYHSEGGQSYVFTSADDQYVLKLFKYKRFRPAWFMNLLPNVGFFKEMKESHRIKRAAKLERVFRGHQVAYDFIREESALVAVQLNASHQPQIIKLIDKIGFSHSIDLGQTAYVLQKKGEMLRRCFARCLNQNQVEEVKKRISQIFAFYLAEYQKGIHDEDHGIMQNFGFIDRQPFHLDLGKFSADESYRSLEVYRPELIRVAFRINLWMNKYYPSYASEIKLHMEKELSHFFNEPFIFGSF